MDPNKYPWFYAPELPKSGEISLDAEELRHIKVQRIKPEDKVSLFNGKGTVAICTITSEGKARIIEVHEVPKSTFSLFIAVGVPKGERADWMLQKLGELGASSIIPLQTECSVVLPRKTKQERWQRILTEACKQSKQAWIPELKPLSTIEEALKQEAELKVLLDQTGKNTTELLQEKPKSVLAFIGPEGGFTQDEKKHLLASGCRLVSLCKQTLRVETAAIAMAVVINILGKNE